MIGSLAPAEVAFEWESNCSTALIDCTGPSTVSVSYAQLDRVTAAIAGELAHRGATPGSRILLSLPNGIDLALLYLACLRGGYTAVPLNPEFPVALADHVRRLARPVLAVGTGEFPKGLPGWRLAAPGELVALPSKAKGPEWNPSGDVPLLIAFTSGSTGMPKGVVHAAGRMLGNAAAFNRSAGIDRSTRMVHAMPMSYMAGILNTLLSPLVAGGTVLLTPQLGAGTVLTFWDAARRHNGNATWLSPTMANMLIRLNRDPSLRDWTAANLSRVFVGTAPLRLQTWERFREQFGCVPLESWGMTEVLLGSVVPPADGRAGSVGTTIAGVEVEIRGESHAPASDRTGALWVRSTHQALGYLTAEGGIDTAISSPDGWFDTGDMASVDSQGFISIVGRRKDIIIRGGTNISPQAVEDALLACAGVADVAVIGMDSEFWGEDVIACLELSDGATMADLEGELRRACLGKLPKAAVPSRFVSFPSLPRSSTGKIQKSMLKEWLNNGARM